MGALRPHFSEVVFLAPGSCIPLQRRPKHGTTHLTAAGEQHNHHQLVLAEFVVGAKPTQVRGRPASVQVPVLPKIGSLGLKPARLSGAVFDRAHHAGLDLGQPLRDVELPLYARYKLHRFPAANAGAEDNTACRRWRRPTRCRQFQRRHINSFAETGHHSKPSVGRRPRQGSGLLAIQIQTGLFAQPETAARIR